MKLKQIVIFIVLIGIMLITKESYAAKGSFSVSASSTKVNVGKTTTISVKANSCAGQFTASSSDSSVLSINSQPDWADNSTVTFTVTAKKAGKATISVKASDVTDYDENAVTGSKGVSITVSKPSSSSGNSGNTTNNVTPATTNTKSSNNYLSDISASIGDLNPTFNRNTKEYTLTVENKVTKIDIYATKESSKATYAITGNTDLKVGDNNVKVTVTAENGNKNTYTIIVKRADVAVMPLATLSIGGFTLTPAFNPKVYEYTLNLEEYKEKIEVVALPQDENTPVEVVGEDTLKEGRNVISITLKSADGSEKTVYNITVNVPAYVAPEEEKKEDNLIAGIFGNINNISKDKLVIGGVSVLTIATIIMLIFESYKERKNVGANSVRPQEDQFSENIEEKSDEENIFPEEAKSIKDKYELFTKEVDTLDKRRKAGKRFEN